MKRDKNKELVLEQLRKMPIIKIAVDRAKISRATYYLWRDQDKNFRKAAERAIAEGEILITEMSESQLISLIGEKNFPAIQLWLKHHHPSYKAKLELSGRIEHLRQELTEEEKQLIERALRLAMPDQNKQNYGQST